MSPRLVRTLEPPMPPLFADLLPFDDFETTAQAVLAYLHERLGFALWMMTRTEGEDWVVLQAEDHGYDVEAGQVFRWTDSLCSRMVLGQGPRIAPSTHDVPAYAAAPIGQAMTIGAYIGVPVFRSDGSLFGTLCAIDPQPCDASIRDEQPLVELLAQLLGTLLARELEQVDQARRLARAQTEADTDALTGLLNRRAWERQVAAEEVRARRYGTPVGILIIDVDGLKAINDTRGHAVGDAVIADAAKCLTQTTRTRDVVARLGGDEFGVITPECDAMAVAELEKRLGDALASCAVRASVGAAIRDPRSGLAEAIDRADRAMYAHKASRQG
jgi:diguanylate cyclase (GGDEF)-like protein